MANEGTRDTTFNRTGMALAPIQGPQVREAGEKTRPTTPGDADGLLRARADWIGVRVPVGSMPPPSSVTGAVKSGIAALKGDHPNVLLDKLGERLAFERTGVRLYDALIAAVEALGEEPHGPSLAALREIRDEEARHFGLVKAAIEELGGDPTCVTPCADGVGVASAGLVAVSTDPRSSRSQRLHAILVAELTDNEGWEMLIDLCRAAGRGPMAERFETALVNERSHLARVRAWMRRQSEVNLKEGRSGVDV